MPRVRIFHYLYPPYLLLLILALFLAGWYSTSSFRDFYLRQVSEELEHRAQILATALHGNIISGNYKELDKQIKLIGGKSSTRVTIILPDGKVVADSHADPSSMENHLFRPEVQEALKSETGRITRYSSTLKENIDYVAMTMHEADGKTNAVIRTSLPLDTVESALETIQFRIAYGGVVIAILSGFVLLIVSRKLIAPLQELAQGARRITKSTTYTKLPLANAIEISEVAESINEMSEKLQGRLAELEQQKNEVETLLRGMSEGVIAVDTDRRITKINLAALSLIESQGHTLDGKLVHEVIRNAGFLSLIDHVFTEGGHYEDEVVFYQPVAKTMLVHGTLLKDSDGSTQGAIFVLSDITKLRRLEQVRKDFVANVSHELKTPVTSIKGFSETLLRGGLDDHENAKKFIAIIDKHAERLRAIIDDLLTLSRLEKQDTGVLLEKSEVKARVIINGALEACQRKIDDKKVNVRIDLNPDTKCLVNESLIEQALVNLIDNAVKYGREGGNIIIGAEERGNESILWVTDNGSGIEQKHLDRVFERFYRIDPGRSRESGGTGLGLAIVKHIATVHGGYPEVTSIPGEGSTFSIHIPKA